MSVLANVKMRVPKSPYVEALRIARVRRRTRFGNNQGSVRARLRQADPLKLFRKWLCVRGSQTAILRGIVGDLKGKVEKLRSRARNGDGNDFTLKVAARLFGLDGLCSARGKTKLIGSELFLRRSHTKFAVEDPTIPS